MKLLVIFFFVIEILALGNPPPKGTTVCVEDCDFQDRPLGVRSKGKRTPLNVVKDIKIPRKKPRKPSRARRKISKPIKPTNLPRYYSGVSRAQFEASDKVLFVPEFQSPTLKGIGAGDLVHAVVEQAVKASPSVPSPIRALVTSGPLKGSYFFGHAKLDRELKRVLLTFTKLKHSSGQAYNTKATGLDIKGRVGLEGEYHSKTGQFFLAELGAATAAAFVDSTTKRSQNILGNYVEEPSAANAAKKGAVAALSRTADRIAEKARNAPEYSETSEFLQIQVIFEDELYEKET